jgi:hypothetical protein
MEDYKPVSSFINMKELKAKSGFLVKKFNDAIFMGEINA